VDGVAGEALEQVRGLFVEYADSLPFGLGFQNFDEELAGLPGEYAPPNGRLLLALWDDRAAACAALRPFGGGDCEMKRMFVRPAFRGRGMGRILAERLVADARSIGYGRMLLDTHPSMREAIALYRSLGFGDIPAYRFNPVQGAVYMALELR
jgi:ribosomal protein S18 acetylase RimI-like enzyme